VKDFGPSNVYVSITESGSYDNTKGALQDLEAELQILGVKHRIITGINHEEQQDMLRALPVEGKRQGWVYTGRPEKKAGKDGWEMRRIPYLAKERNTVMEPLFEGPEGQWDKILWINDVVFTVCLPAHFKPGHMADLRNDLQGKLWLTNSKYRPKMF